MKRFATTSDVTRPRALALGALGAMAGVSIAMCGAGAPPTSAHPVGRPHAKLACASCHEAPKVAASTAQSVPVGAAAWSPVAACKSCHGTTHGSSRAPHRALAAQGVLTCTTCHPAHAGAQGITFAPDGTILRWGAGAEIAVPRSRGIEVAPGAVRGGTTVPLVSLASCTGCHDPSRAADPIARCVPAPARRAGTFDHVATQCYDEHRGASEHESARFVTWDAARQIANASPWVTAETKQTPPWMPLGGAAVGAFALGLVSVAVDRRQRRKRTASAPAAKALSILAPPTKKRLPVVDPTTCLGCYACVDACPFDVLEVQKYVAVVARPDECCGVVLCEQVCPNGSLRVDEGDPILGHPDVDEHLESRDVRGVFLAGDLTGMPLIKNAIHQGTRVVDRIAKELETKGARGRADAVDVIVVGAGPAGLAAALRAKEKGLSCIVLEQATFAASIKSFPRDKIVHDPPIDLPVEGELWLREATKEELVAQWTRIVRVRELDIREGRRVVGIARPASEAGTAEVFEVEADRGGEGDGRERFRARRIVLAIGRRGSPRQLDLDIESGVEERIAYALADARSFAEKRVVIAGLGDVAMEAAVAIARQPGARVTLVHRGDGFRRGKARNVAEVRDLVDKGRIKLLFETTPIAVTRSGVVVRSSREGGATRTLPADALLALIGGEASWDLLTRIGVRRPRAS